MNSQNQFSITSNLWRKSNFFSKTGHSLARLFLMLAALAISTVSSSAQFPAVGADSGPGIIITITGNNASITFTGQGPYDSIDDTYVGVINNSSRPIYAMQIRSTLDIFGFDGDGIFGTDSTTGLPFDPKPPGGPYGPTGYEGPGVSFSDISSDQTYGTVSFNPPIAVGGTSYFSLEESITAVCSAPDVLNNSVTRPAGGSTSIQAIFQPQCGGTGGNPPTLQQAAALCGFTEFDWQSTITKWPAPSHLFAASAPSTPLVAPPAFNDPPPSGYAYQNPPNAVQLPVYWNLSTAASDPLSLLANELPTMDPSTSTMLSFYDQPANPYLPAGSQMAFTTHLVGIVGSLPGATVVDTGIGFNWTSDFNGTSGGITVANNTSPVDPGSGTGGITVMSFQNTTTYQYNGIVITTLNGVEVGLDRDISLTGNLAFGGVPINSSTMNPMTISNGGDGDLTISNIVFPSGYSGAWSTNPIPPGATETVTVTFSPTAATTYYGDVTVYSDATSGSGVTAISGYGASGNLVLVVLTNGNGRVSPNLNGKTLAAGTRHTLRAIPNDGFVFSNWIGSIITNENPLTFTMKESTLLQANFVSNPFVPVKGTYDGLFSASNGVTEATSGMIKSLVITDSGAYSGTILINGAAYAVSGTFDLGLAATNVIKRPSIRGGPLLLEMALVTSINSAPQILGTVAGTNNLVPWSANLMANLGTNALPSTEYTMLVLPDTNNAPPILSPGGYGYLLITNYPGTAKSPESATTRITGALADGTALNQAVPVSQAGFVPIYASLYAGKGLLLGWLNIVLTNTNGGVGLTWIHPARTGGLYPLGFTNTLSANQILLSEWTNSPFANPNITSITNLSFLDNANTVTNVAVKINDAGKVSGAAVNGEINSKTGLLKVTIGTGADRISATGAILLNATNGGGFFLTKTNAQGIQFSP